MRTIRTSRGTGIPLDNDLLAVIEALYHDVTVQLDLDRSFDDMMKEIRSLVDQMEQAVKAKDARHYHLLNLQFHDRLVELAGNGKLTAIYRKLIKELSLFRRLNLADGWLMPMSANEHRLIVKAIASGDADAAGRAMFQHVIESKERTIKNNLRQSAPPEPAPPASAAPARSKLRRIEKAS